MTARSPFQELFQPKPRNIAREVQTLITLGLLTVVAVVWLIYAQAFQRLEVLT